MSATLGTIDDDEATTGKKRFGKMAKDGFQSAQLMVRIGNENGIGLVFRQVRISRFANNDLNVVLALKEAPEVEKKKRKSPKIDRNNVPSLPNHIRKFQREISRA